MSRNLGPLTAEPRVYESAPSQPISWHTQKFRCSLRTVLPHSSIGTNMTLLKNIKKELLPLANNKLASRWRHQPRLTGRPREGQVYFEPERQEQESTYDPSRHPHAHVRPPSAYSATIKLRRGSLPWLQNKELNVSKLHALMKNNTFTAGNFSTLNRSTKQRVSEVVDRLYYDPYERREQNALSQNPDEADERMYTLEEVQAIVKRLAKLKEYSKEEPQPERKAAGELTAREKEIVDRLTRRPESTKFKKGDESEKSEADKDKKEDDEKGDEETEESTEEKKPKTVTKAQLDEIIARLTKYDPAKCPADSPASKLPEVKDESKLKVSSVEMDAILSRLMTFDSTKWPPESRPDIYKLLQANN